MMKVGGQLMAFTVDTGAEHAVATTPVAPSQAEQQLLLGPQGTRQPARFARPARVS